MAAKLTVHSVLGEGVKLIFDVPEQIQDCFDFKPNEVLDTNQLELMMAIAAGSRDVTPSAYPVFSTEAERSRPLGFARGDSMGGRNDAKKWQQAKQTTDQIIHQMKKAANDC